MFFILASSLHKPAIKSALLQQGVILVLAAGILDGGDIFSICLIALVAFWTGVFLIRRRRPQTPTRIDLFMIRGSYIPLCVIAFFLVHWFWRLRGLPGLL
jgi:hypothetical protein